MSQQINSTLFPHPFSRAYWRAAASELRRTRVLVFAALMVALRVVLKTVSIPLGPELRINTDFFVNAYGAMVFGPVVAIIAAAISDTLGCLFFPVGVYFFPFIFIEISGSLVFALLFYRARITSTRVILSRFLIDFGVNVVLTTPVMWLYYKMVMGRYYALVDLPRILKNLSCFPIESLLLILFFRAVIPRTRAFGLIYSDAEKLRFSKRIVALLAALLVVGVGTVTGYSIYSYNTTSLSASYSAQERTEKNMAMRAYALEALPELEGEDVVCVIESALPKLGESQITYSVAVYTVDAAELEANIAEALAEDPESTYGRETLDGYSKSKARADDALIPVDVLTFRIEKGEI